MLIYLASLEETTWPDCTEAALAFRYVRAKNSNSLYCAVEIERESSSSP